MVLRLAGLLERVNAQLFESVRVRAVLKLQRDTVVS